MKSSNLPDVGQIRRSKGTSMKRMTKEVALKTASACGGDRECDPDGQCWRREDAQSARDTHRHKAAKGILPTLNVMMLASPTAKHTIMLSTPDLIAS